MNLSNGGPVLSDAVMEEYLWDGWEKHKTVNNGDLDRSMINREP